MATLSLKRKPEILSGAAKSDASCASTMFCDVERAEIVGEGKAPDRAVAAKPLSLVP
jgi:hypothetical protein